MITNKNNFGSDVQKAVDVKHKLTNFSGQPLERLTMEDLTIAHIQMGAFLVKRCPINNYAEYSAQF